MIYNPDIIIQCLSTQATYINRRYGQMFYYTDKAEIWVDTQNGGRILVSDIYIMNYERERNNYIPNNRSTLATELDMLTEDQIYLDSIYVYVVETNCLYYYHYSSRTWTRVYGIYGQTTVAQTYLPNGDAVIVNADDVTTNGILNDGSVVIRDQNKMICGLVKSDGYSLYIKSLIGGQLNLEPSGLSNDNGCLQLNSENNDTNLNNNLVVFGNIKTTNKENWNKQYRLITQDIEIKSYTLIKKGSTLCKNSVVDGNKYNQDTIINEDIITESDGLIVIGSKIYKNSIINGAILNPPFMFDLDYTDIKQLPSNYSIYEENVINVENNKLKININSPFIVSGDCCYIKTTGLNLLNLKQIEFKDKIYNIDYITKEGIENTATIKYYDINNTVKILV